MFRQVIGYRDFHAEDHFNFQFNRWLPFLPEEELHEIAQQITDFESWKHVFSRYAQQAESEQRFSHATYYYRAAEFFMADSDPDKKIAYRKMTSLFDKACQHIPYRREQIPYLNGYLPALTVAAKGEQKDILIVHGGFDSFAEELLPQLIEATEWGFKVIFFEGPGQGFPLQEFNMPMPNNWELPVAAVLDHFNIKACTLLGISLGGYLATRAAAFEPRIKRVIADDVMEDFYDCLANRIGAPKMRIINTLLKLNMKSTLNSLMAKAAKQDVISAWAMNHGLKVSGSKTYFDYLKWAQQMNTRSISHRVTQDYLLLAGREDHMVPLDQFYRQAKSLVNVNSFTGRVFTNKEHAGNHCHIGNATLANNVMFDWISGLLDRDKSITNNCTKPLPKLLEQA
ncbi:alpha/beta hydrolase [Maricurvus nonylphenolicus]|uniref:alpha/beta fold hydrolase n=1 Tax=Maricurvus nonylphenolicus TaxID=1008307 RepID=UPI0036F41048